jgi:hypothetical protein
MGIFDRLGNLLSGYLNSEDGRIFRRDFDAPFGDPDIKAAYEELDEFLRHNYRDGAARKSRAWESPGSDSYWETDTRDTKSRAGRPPEELRPDFAELGLPFGASAGECKTAYKKLLNIHHPDRHAGHSGNMKKATEKSARINAAYDRIEKWRAGKE